MEDVMPYDKKIKEGTIVLFNTNWYKKEGTEEFFEHPYVSVEVAEYLVNKGVKFLCIDTINADQTGGTEFPVHDWPSLILRVLVLHQFVDKRKINRPIYVTQEMIFWNKAVC